MLLKHTAVEYFYNNHNYENCTLDMCDYCKAIKTCENILYV